jgi:hypothetical protein
MPAATLVARHCRFMTAGYGLGTARSADMDMELSPAPLVTKR